MILKTVALWTLLPLLINSGESLIKHLIFALDYLLSAELFVKIDQRSILLTVLLLLVTVVQSWQAFYVEFFMKKNPGWMHRY
jgi:hypothetical protein